MARYAFDIEANGFLESVTRIHCMALIDLDTHATYKFRPHEVEQGVKMLAEADLLVGHNIIKYDIPVIQLLFPWFNIERAKVQDTLVLSRVCFTDLSDSDFRATSYKMPNGKLIGSHSLKAWGYRLGFNKLEYEGGWVEFSEEMLEYNTVDTEVTVRLWNYILKENLDPRANELEHEVAFIVAQQERHGFCFDVQKAEVLAANLQSRLASLESKLQDVFPPFYTTNGKVTVPKRTTNGTKIAGTWANAPYQKIKLTIFNPGSRQHVAMMLKRRYQWVPTEFTPSGEPKVDEKVLSKLSWPEAKMLVEYYTASKVLGYLIGKDHDKGWLNVYRMADGEPKVFGECITNGAVTGRGTHKVIANIPRVTSPFGAECRSLFRASRGRVQVGVDASGLELRMLAHFLAKWDGGSYGKTVCEGDVHTANQQAAGLSTRDQSKTFIYAFLYGGGDVKIGSIVDPLAKEVNQRSRGKSLKAKFIEKTPGLQELTEGVRAACQRGYLIGLDGRKLRIRSSHAALNTLLQSAGSLICKRWMVELDHEITRRGWHNVVQQLIWYHDELQFEVVPDYADEFCKVAVECISRAADYFNMRVPLTGEAKVGANWAECH